MRYVPLNAHCDTIVAWIAAPFLRSAGACVRTRLHVPAGRCMSGSVRTAADASILATSHGRSRARDLHPTALVRIRRPQRGFTLVELMVVVAIVGVAAGLAVWGFGAQRPRQRLLGTATELHALLASARQTALSSGSDVAVLFYPDFALRDGGRGRVVLYQDGDFDFFVPTSATNFDLFDPARLDGLDASALIGDRDDVLDTMDLPREVVFGPATGVGVGQTMPAPFAGIPLDAACTFCLGADGRGAIVFDAQGAARFHSAAAPALAIPVGASVSLTADDTRELKTVVVAAPTGSIRTLSFAAP